MLRQTLRRRAAILDDVRRFFAAQRVLEVETPILVPSPGVDRHIEAFGVEGGFLATSPEYHMKRLLASGSGPIFQLTRAFRRNERGALHNPEFTILEWYRPGWDHERLMDEVEELLAALAGAHAPGDPLSTRPYRRTSFADAFAVHAGVDPHGADTTTIREACETAPAALDRSDRAGWLALLQSERVEPRLGVDRPEFVHSYPADQCALARIRPGSPPVAERFELYRHGVELANGFHELNDPVEQRARIDAENRARRQLGRPPYPVDEAFIESLADLPDCAGVAVGMDRVVMCLLGASGVDEVMAFPGAISSP